MKPGDKVRLRDGAHLWIAQRDGWTVGNMDDKTSSAIVKRDDAAICVHQDDIEPESPPIPPEPDAPAVLLRWGAPLHTEITMARTWDGRWAMPSDSLTYTWKHIPQLDTATATPLYPVPDPNNGRAVNDLWFSLPETFLCGLNGVRDVLRALRATNG